MDSVKNYSAPLIVAATAISYYVCAVLGGLLTLWPLEESLFWPSAGLAVAATMLAGKWGFWGVLLGSFLFRLNSADVAVPDQISLLSISGDTIISLAVAVQAYITGKILNHFKLLDSLSRNYTTVFQFLLVISLCSVVVAFASLAVAAMFSGSGLSLTATFVSVWIGNSTGMLLFLPLVYLPWSPLAVNTDNHFSALAILLISISLSVAYSVSLLTMKAVVSAQRDRVEEVVQIQTNTLASVITQGQSPLSGNGYDEQIVSEQIARVLDGWSGPGETGNTAVARMNQSQIDYLVTQRVGNNGAALMSASSDEVNRPMNRALLGQSGSMLARNWQGQRVISAYSYIEPLGLGLVVEMQLNEIVQPVYSAAILAVVLTVLISMLGVTGANQLTAPVLSLFRHKSRDLELLVEEKTTELKEGQERMSAVLESAPDALVIVNWEGEILLINKQLENLTGYEPDELLGEKLDKLIPARFRHAHNMGMTNYIRKPGYRLLGTNQELFCTTKNGDEIPVDISLSSIDDGDNIRIAAAIRDITERKNAQVKLEESKLRLDAALRGGNLGLWDWDIESDEIFTNEYWSEMLGHDEKELIAEYGNGVERFIGLIHPEDADQARLDRKKYLENAQEDAFRSEYRMRTSFGEWRWMLNIGRAVKYNKAGEVTRLVGVQLDVTEQRKLEEELTLAKEIAEFATDAKASFLASMSHEIRTPMNAIIGLVDLLRQRNLKGEEKDMLRTISESGQSLLSIINDILDLSKIEAGRMNLEEIPFSIKDAVEGVLKTVSLNARKKKLNLVSYIDPTLPAFVNGDPVRLRQIIINLVGNAIKFTEKGFVEVYVTPSEEKGGRLGIKIRVKDTGVGIAKEAQKELFTAFSQAETSTTRKYGGTGLGLSICQRLAEVMNGDISVNSIENKGTTFTVDIWLRNCQQVIRDHPGQTLEGTNVLVVVSDSRYEFILRKYLSHWNVTVDTVSNIESAVERCVDLRNGPDAYDIIVLGDRAPKGTLLEKVDLFNKNGCLNEKFIVLVSEPIYGSEVLNNHVVAVECDPLSRSAYISAVAIAIGKASPEAHYTEDIEKMTPDAELLPVEEAREKGQLILVAEDNPTNRDVIGRQLHMLGYNYEMAEDGKLAFETWQKGNYGLILSDCHMPEWDGFEFTDAVRQQEKREGKGCRIPILAITANAMEGEAERCLEAGMDGYMAKPVDLRDLKRNLKQWMPPLDEENNVDTFAIVSTTNSDKNEQEMENQGDEVVSIDENVLKGMFGDDVVVFKEILGDFVQPSQQIIDEIKAAYADGDADGVSKAAHKLKSAARSVGAHALGDLLVDLESAGREDKLDESQINVLDLDTHMAEIESYIARL